MVINQVLNNNVVSALDAQGQEVILMGKGLGWQAKSGQPVAEDKVQKRFRMDMDSGTEQFKRLLLEVRPEVLEVSSMIIDNARSTLGCQLNKNIYITLTDHISFAIERCQQGCSFGGVMVYDIKKFYTREYRIGQRALELICLKLKVKLPQEEAAAIALHIINSELERDMSMAVETAAIIRKSLDFVSYSFGLKLDEEDLNYQRFVTHLKFFAQRVLEGKLLDSGQGEIFWELSKKYVREAQVAEKIRYLTAQKYGCDIPEEEVAFLTVHIARLTNKLKQK